LTGPFGEHGERLGEDGRGGCGGGRGGGGRGGGGGQTEATGFDNVARGDYHEHEPELKAFDYVGAGELKEVFFLELFEDGGFNFNELIGHEKGEEGV